MALRFAPRWHWTLLTAALLPVFVALGLWQWNRGQARQQNWDAFADAASEAVPASANQLARLPRYTRVEVTGRYDAARQFLLDNRSHAGMPGYEVLTVLELDAGGRLLVNRGWVPFTGFRDQLPDIALPANDADAAQPPMEGDAGQPGDFPGSAQRRLTGRLAGLPVAGLASGRLGPEHAQGWPRVTSFPTMAQLEAAYGGSLLPPVLLLDEESGPGYVRDWQPPGLPPERHIGYAVQWWGFALLLVGLYVGLNLKRRDA